MGGSSSKPTFTPDTSKASISVDELDRQLKEAQRSAAEAISSTSTGFMKWIWILLGVLVLITVGLLIYFYAIKPSIDSSMLTAGEQAYHTGATLTVQNATHGATTITDSLNKLITNGNTLTVAPSLSANLGVANLKTTDRLTVTYQYSDEISPRTYISADNVALSISTTTRPSGDNTTSSSTPPGVGTARKPKSKTGSTIFGKIQKLLGGSDSSGDQLPYAKDGKSEATIPSASAPLEDGNSGSYGMQFWMYIKDWNYNYGKEKNVISRPDSSNRSVLNPNITLHPTDNTLKVSISIFPDSSTGSSKTEPAPAGHSGSTDDVFLCEVPNIPLQTWFAVSITLFQRNLDIYLNGKLVKSCVLSGVPKPAVGDISLNTNGGFSGKMCAFYHYPRMLTPGDAQSFYSAGTACAADDGPSTTSKVTGYDFKFGIYDATGKLVTDYKL
jgi:hypothetical protein